MLPLCGGKQLTSAPLRVLIVDWLRLSKSSTLYVKWISKGMTNMCPMKYLAVFATFHETTAPDPFAWHHIINDSLLKTWQKCTNFVLRWVKGNIPPMIFPFESICQVWVETLQFDRMTRELCTLLSRSQCLFANNASLVRQPIDELC